MKKVIIIILFAAFTAALNAQTAIDRIFDKYAGKEGYTTVLINSFMFKFLSDIETNDPDYETFRQATSGIESIRILAQEGSQSAPFGKELLDILPRNEYEELMVVKESDEEVVFLVKEEGGEIVEFLLIVSGSDGEDALIAITGIIDMESIASLSSGMDLPAMENLENLEEEEE